MLKFGAHILFSTDENLMIAKLGDYEFLYFCYSYLVFASMMDQDM